MPISEDIESEIDVDGVVAWPAREQFYAVGQRASELPDDVLGFEPVDDPALVE